MSAVSSTHVPVLGALERDGLFGSLTAPTYAILLAQEPYERLGLLVASLFPFLPTIWQVFFIGQRASLVATGNSEVHRPGSLKQDPFEAWNESEVPASPCLWVLITDEHNKPRTVADEPPT